MRRYASLLREEIGLLPRAGQGVDTVFLGGGTPSLMPPGEIASILESLKERYAVDRGAEITIECNPGTLTEEKLQEYLSAGCNRISLGVQSTHDRLLQEIGRIHTAKQAVQAVEQARRAGFENINVDLMYGLPGQSVEEHLRSIEAMAALSPQHMSVYSLIVEEGTPLWGDVKEKRAVLPSEEEEYRMHREGIELLQSLGYGRYEISNFARHGFECRHNLRYWLSGDYLAAGLGASSALWEEGRRIRRTNLAEFAGYEQAVLSGRLPIGETVADSEGEARFEFVMMALRLCDGFSQADFQARFGLDLRSAYPAAVRRSEREGLLLLEEGRWRLSDRGLDLQNIVLERFLEESCF